MEIVRTITTDDSEGERLKKSVSAFQISTTTTTTTKVLLEERFDIPSLQTEATRATRPDGDRVQQFNASGQRH